MGDLEIKNVAVNDKGEVNGSASQVPIMNGVLQADITVSGTVKDKKANLLIDVSAPLTPGTDPIKMKLPLSEPVDRGIFSGFGHEFGMIGRLV